jgi:uncharacterized C2H2 Zn-finger protein
MYPSTHSDDPNSTLSAEIGPYSPLVPFTTEFGLITTQRYHGLDLAEFTSPDVAPEALSNSIIRASLQSSLLVEDSISSITDPLLDELSMFCESPGPIWNYTGLGKGLEEIDYGLGYIGSHLDLPTGNWAGVWGPNRAECAESRKEPSIFSSGLACSACPTEPGDSVLPAVPIPIPPLNRRRGRALSNRSSRTEELLQYSSSEPRRFRIDPIKPSRSHTQDTTELSRCNTCDRQFTLRKDLERHKLSKHNDWAKWLCPISSCPFATRGFKRKDKAHQHIRTHQRSSDVVLKPMLNAVEESAHRLLTSKSSQATGTLVSSEKITSAFIGSGEQRYIEPGAGNHKAVTKNGRFLDVQSVEEPKSHSCQYPDCGAAFFRSKDLEIHVKLLHLNI